MQSSPRGIRRLFAPVAACVAVLTLAGCGSGFHQDANQAVATQPAAAAKPTATTKPTAVTQNPTGTDTAGNTSATTSTTPLPGTGKPPVVIGDKNFTEEFVLGELYYQALRAQGFDVSLDRNIGPTSVSVQALATGRLAMYPENLQTWNSDVAGYRRGFRSAGAAYQAGQHFALAHGFVLLNPTPFSDTGAIAVTVAYGAQNRLRSIIDLRRVAASLTLGGPLQFAQGPGALLPVLEQTYGFQPASFTALAVGQQYPSLNQGSIQAANVNTTDGELATGDYTLLRDPANVFGWGNVVPVMSTRALDEEGPVFAATVNHVSSLLTTSVIRQLNELVDVAGQSPAAVATAFLQTHGLLSSAP
jgi:osmoprotectant transport system substrate-binding protein